MSSYSDDSFEDEVASALDESVDGSAESLAASLHSLAESLAESYYDDDDFEEVEEYAAGPMGASSVAGAPSASIQAVAPRVEALRASTGDGSGAEQATAEAVSEAFESVMGDAALVSDVERHTRLEQTLAVLQGKLGLSDAALSAVLCTAHLGARMRLARAPKAARAAEAARKGAASAARRGKTEATRKHARIKRAFAAAAAEAHDPVAAAEALKQGLANARRELGGLSEQQLAAQLTPVQVALRDRIRAAALSARRALVAHNTAARAQQVVSTNRAKARKPIEKAFRAAAALPEGTPASERSAALERALREARAVLNQGAEEFALALPPPLRALRAELRATARAERLAVARAALDACEGFGARPGGPMATSRAISAAVDKALAALPKQLGLEPSRLAALLEADKGLLPSIAGAPPPERSPLAQGAGAPLATYDLEIVTSDVAGAGTDGAVSVDLVGEGGARTGATVLPADASGAFARGAVASFIVEAPDVGELVAAEVGLQGAGSRWRCSELSVAAAASGDRVRFECGRWLRGSGDDDRNARTETADSEPSSVTLQAALPARTHPLRVALQTADVEGVALQRSEGHSLWIEMLYGASHVPGRRFNLTSMTPTSMSDGTTGGEGTTDAAAPLARGTRCAYDLLDTPAGELVAVRMGVTTAQVTSPMPVRYWPQLVEVTDPQTLGQVAFVCDSRLEKGAADETGAGLSEATFARAAAPARRRRLVKVVVHISAHASSGGDSNLSLELSGPAASSKPTLLSFPAGHDGRYKPGRAHVFIVEMGSWGPSFRAATLSSDCAGFDPDLHVKAVEVSDLCPGEGVETADAVFVVDSWLSATRGECFASRELVPVDDAQRAMAVLRSEDSAVQVAAHGGAGASANAGAHVGDRVHTSVMPIKAGMIDVMEVGGRAVCACTRASTSSSMPRLACVGACDASPHARRLTLTLASWRADGPTRTHAPAAR